MTDEDYRDLYENAPCGYVSTRPDGRIYRVNGTFASWLGHSAEELTQKRFQDLLNIAGKIYYETHFAPLLRMQGFFNEVALDLVCADGKVLPALVNALERREPNGEPSFIRITVFNASDRRRYERELLAARKHALEANEQIQVLNVTLEQRVVSEVEQRMKAEEALRQAQRLEVIGQNAGGIAHDFNNLLTIIMGGLDTIGRRLQEMNERPDVERIKRAHEIAWEGCQRATALTSRLLAFARRRPLDPKPVNVNELLRGLMQLLRATLGERIVLEVLPDQEIWLTHADASELENAILNLVTNARDAMPDGGNIAIATRNCWLEQDRVGKLAEPVTAGPYVVVEVSDTGRGMDQETLNHVFEPFFTTKAVGKGTGLGLSQVYGFVKQSGGFVMLHSEVGKGTTVQLFLPRMQSF